MGYRPWDQKKLDTSEQLTLHFIFPITHQHTQSPSKPHLCLCLQVGLFWIVHTHRIITVNFDDRFLLLSTIFSRVIHVVAYQYFILRYG